MCDCRHIHEGLSRGTLHQLLPLQSSKGRFSVSAFGAARKNQDVPYSVVSFSSSQAKVWVLDLMMRSRAIGYNVTPLKGKLNMACIWGEQLFAALTGCRCSALIFEDGLSEIRKSLTVHVSNTARQNVLFESTGYIPSSKVSSLAIVSVVRKTSLGADQLDSPEQGRRR